MKCFSIKDTKAEGFNTPFFQNTFGLAERSFKEACQDPQTSLSKNKEDFSLWYLGEFDQKTGTIRPENPQLICQAQ